MNAIERLIERGPVVTDGAWGTQLQARGLAAGECPDNWNLTRPADVAAVARAYVEAGSAVILTNTFRANRLAFSGDVEAVNRTGVEISRSAANGAAAVFASIGPSGKMLLSGEVTEDELLHAFRGQARALAAAGPDALLVETMSDLAEAKLALAAALETGLPVVVSMVFDSGRNRDRTMMGATPERVAEELTAAGAHAVGANCGRGIEGYVEIARRLRAATDRPVWIKANAGLPELVDGQPVYRVTPEQFASYAPAVLEAGASFIGGCCGTGPDFIRAVKECLALCA